MYDLSEKVIIVTGSGRGIGNAIALKLAKEEATVVINTKKRIDELNETLEEKRIQRVNCSSGRCSYEGRVQRIN